MLDEQLINNNNINQPEDTANGQPTNTHQGAQQLQEDVHL
jgi:hypothetical protein